MTGSLGGRVLHSEASPIAIPPPQQSAATDPGPFFCTDAAWVNSLTGGSPFTAPVAAVLGADGDLYVAFQGTDFARYSVVGDSWTALTSMPFTAGGRGGMIANGFTKVLVFSSNGSGTASTRNYHFTTVAAWESSLAAMPTPRRGFALVVGLGDGVHLIGGTKDSGGDSAVHEVYSVGGNSWTTKAAVDVTVRKCSASLGPSGDIFLWGVGGSGQTIARRWRKLTDAWEALPTTPPWGTTGQGDLVVQPFVVAGNIVILVGGGDGAGFDSTLFWSYDPASDAYVPMPAADTAILDISAPAGLPRQLYALSSAADLRKFIC